MAKELWVVLDVRHLNRWRERRPCSKERVRHDEGMCEKMTDRGVNKFYGWVGGCITTELMIAYKVPEKLSSPRNSQYLHTSLISPPRSQKNRKRTHINTSNPLLRRQRLHHSRNALRRLRPLRLLCSSANVAMRGSSHRGCAGCWCLGGRAGRVPGGRAGRGPGGRGGRGGKVVFRFVFVFREVMGVDADADMGDGGEEERVGTM